VGESTGDSSPARPSRSLQRTIAGADGPSWIPGGIDAFEARWTSTFHKRRYLLAHCLILHAESSQSTNKRPSEAVIENKQRKQSRIMSPEDIPLGPSDVHQAVSIQQPVYAQELEVSIDPGTWRLKVWVSTCSCSFVTGVNLYSARSRRTSGEVADFLGSTTIQDTLRGRLGNTYIQSP
jgi:hypothetical protein